MITYDDELRERIRQHLAGHERRQVPLDERRRAAVALVVVDSDAERDGHDPIAKVARSMDHVPGNVVGMTGNVSGTAGGAALLMCRRSAGLSSHPTQWALPGGRIEPEEQAVDAALRELHEELGLVLDTGSVLGFLDDYGTRSGYVITPIVVWGGGDVVLDPNPAEVAHAYRIGLHELCREDSPRFVTIPESDRPVVQLPIGKDLLLHAPTGAVLLQFRWVALEGRIGERVDHLEQPVFAWR